LDIAPVAALGIAQDWVVDPGEALGKRFSSAAAALAS
jgi:hypothetical protein